MSYFAIRSLIQNCYVLPRCRIWSVFKVCLITWLFNMQFPSLRTREGAVRAKEHFYWLRFRTLQNIKTPAIIGTYLLGQLYRFNARVKLPTHSRCSLGESGIGMSGVILVKLILPSVIILQSKKSKLAFNSLVKRHLEAVFSTSIFEVV